MQTEPRKAVLNRPVFSQTSFSSDALSVLTSWLHQFRDAGRYHVRVTHARRPQRSFVVRVTADAAKLQENVDLTALVEGDGGGCCGDDDAYELAVGGVMGFYPSAGVGGFTVRIARAGDKEERAVADNGEGLPAGDLFAVTLTRPGSYELRAEKVERAMTVRVGLPEGERIRTDRPSLVRLGREGFGGEPPAMHAGQSLVVLCEVGARLRVDLAKEPGGAQPAKGGGRGTRRTVVRRPPTKGGSSKA